MTDSGEAAIALAATGVSKTFQAGKRRVQALQDLSLEVRHGRITGLVGPDGAGKTTFMRLTAGLLLPDTGDISVMDIDVLREPLKVQAALGYMPQRFGLYEDLTVQENLDLYADLQNVPLAERAERYAGLMHMTGLAPFTARQAGRLSGGMKQKLGLACVLVRPPRLLLLDEPTVGVDPVSRRELWSIIQRLVDDQGMSVLLSTAYLDEAERCQEVLLLHEGRLLGRGAPSDFTRDLRGRTYTVTSGSLGKRNLQECLARAPGLVDAVIQGDGVRVVTGDGPPDLAALGVDGEITPVEPRFEDGFMVALHTRQPEREDLNTLTHDVRAGDGSAVIRVDKLQRRFGSFYAVRDISFDVGRGEVFGLLGANGAGKSTTFRMLCGLLPPSGGQLSVAGVDLRRAAATARARIGYMSQKFSLYGNLTVAENLRFFASAYGLKGRARTARVGALTDAFGLSELGDANSADLSLGYKQRLALAAALLHEPDILFLDEPTSGVDPLARREFWRRINTLAEAGVTVLVTTHFMEEAEYCDRLAIMDAGSILALGTPEEVKQRAGKDGTPAASLEQAFIDLLQRHDQEAAA